MSLSESSSWLLGLDGLFMVLSAFQVFGFSLFWQYKGLMMQWQRVILSVFISAMVFTGCEDFPIVEQPVTNLTVGLVTG